MVQIPELFPTKLRTVGHAFCIVVKKAGAVATAYIVTSLITSQLIGSVFLVLNAVAVLACRNLPETTGEWALIYVPSLIIVGYG